MNARLFSRLWKILSVSIFFIAVFFVLLFVQGYEYDPVGHDLVKKGVIFFEAIHAGETVQIFIDGKEAEFSAPGELRLVPGKHDLRIESRDYIPFRKGVLVPMDTIVRFPELRLMPTAKLDQGKFLNPVALQSINFFTLHPFASSSLLLTNEALHFSLLYQARDTGSFTVQELPLSLAPLKKIIPSPFQKHSVYLGLSASSELMSLDLSLGKLQTVAKGPFKDIRESFGRVFLLGEKGSLWELRDMASPPTLFFHALIAAEEISETRRAGDDVRFFLLREKNGVQTLIVTDESGAIRFQERDVGSAYAVSDQIYFTRDTAFMHFSLSEKLLTETVISTPFVWMSEVSDTFHIVAITENKELYFCDRDAENCSSLGMVDLNWMIRSEDHQQFLSVSNSLLTRWDASSDGVFFPFLKGLVFPSE